MSKKSNKSKKIAKLIEIIIDSRYSYLKELDYENRSYATDYKKKHYDPVVKTLVELLEKELDNSAE